MANIMDTRSLRSLLDRRYKFDSRLLEPALLFLLQFFFNSWAVIKAMTKTGSNFENYSLSFLNRNNTM